MKRVSTKPPLPYAVTSLPKTPTGISGLDEITHGGLPAGRPTLVCGSAGSGKTLFAMEFLVHGAMRYGEPGVFVAFEETADDLAQNVSSLGFDLKALIEGRKLVVDHIHMERREIEETGDFDLEGLFIRLGYAIDSIGARRVVLDTVESLFSGLPNPANLRAELRRLMRWLKDKGVTAVITGESGGTSLTRQGIEEYVSDCVIVLDHRISNQASIRRLRVAKYRGSAHGTNEYPFLIDEGGFSVLPMTSLGLDYPISPKRVSTGVDRLDTMLDGEGYYRGSSILISGTAGCGKTSLAAHFAAATCRRGERCLVFLFEESPDQWMRNMGSIGLDLQPWVKRGLLCHHAARPSLHGLEMHLAVSLKAIREFRPDAVVIDPISAFESSGNDFEVKSMLIRLIDSLKVQGITVLMTNLTRDGGTLEHTDAQISSLIDTWLLLRDIELDGERNRGLYVLKSRGMAHSNQIREFLLTDHGVEMQDVYIGAGQVLTGSARLAQQAADAAERLAADQELERQKAALERKRQALQSQIAALQAEFAANEVEAQRAILQSELRMKRQAQNLQAMGVSRRADPADPHLVKARPKGKAARK